MPAGKLRERVKLQSPIVSRDDLGGEVVTWHDEGTVSANVAMLNAREVHAADQLHEAVTIVATVRRGPPITNRWRALWQRPIPEADRVLSVIAVMPPDQKATGFDPRSHWALFCSEGLNDGR